MTVLGTDWAVTARIFSSHSQMLRENFSHRDAWLPGPDEKWSLGLGDWGLGSVVGFMFQFNNSIFLIEP